VICSAAGFSIVRNFGRGDKLLGLLSVCCLISKLISFIMMAQVAFVVRLSQKLSEFEIRRVEADVRTVSANMIHRITPRFKSLLHECHAVGNLGHGMIGFYLPVMGLHVIQLLAGIFSASFGSGGGCVPGWIFAAVFQPLTTLIVWLHAYGSLNLAIERDVDQVSTEPLVHTVCGPLTQACRTSLR